ncbi:MAG: carboxylating nicotinate-nucleotide diphosphorylase [Halioglobus sp.]|nr:carboxylating nicotinate-nucleotide diphosphorylase [Halioglobus sp.]
MNASSPRPAAPPADAVARNVRAALAEDIGSGDITAALIAEGERVKARIISREAGVLCGSPWVDEVFRQLDDSIAIEWQQRDGDAIVSGAALCTLAGPAAAVLTGERCALNFLQLLSGTATLCRHYADRVAGTGTRLLDTRKTLPGLRVAQKYAVRCGGCHNHRMGLYDAFLIKENHIAACGGIAAAVTAAREHAPGRPVEVEVEDIAQLAQALEAGADRIMLDNFDLEQLREAVALTAGRAELEASGNVDENTLLPVAETGVDYISIGALTKDCRALDLSMRVL